MSLFSLDTLASRAIVDHMFATLGEARTLDVLSIAPGRLSAFRRGRGRLTQPDLDRIVVRTRKTWQIWALDASEVRARVADTADARAYLANNQIMRDLYEGQVGDEIARAADSLRRIDDLAAPLRPAAANQPRSTCRPRRVRPQSVA